VYIGRSGVICPVSPKSYANFPFVNVGQAAGSVARNLAVDFPRNLSAMNG